MRRTLRSTAVLLGILLVGAAPALAASSAEALEWLEKASDHPDGFSFLYDASMNGAALGQPSVDVDGQMSFKDKRNKRVKSVMTIAAPGGQGEMNMNVTLAADGEILWMHVENPMGSRVMKIGLEQMEQLERAGGEGAAMVEQMTALDPLRQAERLTEAFDFEIASSDADSVTLVSAMTAESAGKFGMPPEMADSLKTITLVIDKKNRFFSMVTIGEGDVPFLRLHFRDFAKGPSGDFAYTPPDGVQVMDLAGAQSSSAPGGP